MIKIAVLMILPVKLNITSQHNCFAVQLSKYRLMGKKNMPRAESVFFAELDSGTTEQQPIVLGVFVVAN